MSTSNSSCETKEKCPHSAISAQPVVWTRGPINSLLSHTVLTESGEDLGEGGEGEREGGEEGRERDGRGGQGEGRGREGEGRGREREGRGGDREGRGGEGIGRGGERGGEGREGRTAFHSSRWGTDGPQLSASGVRLKCTLQTFISIPCRTRQPQTVLLHCSSPAEPRLLLTAVLQVAAVVRTGSPGTRTAHNTSDGADIVAGGGGGRFLSGGPARSKVSRAA